MEPKWLETKKKSDTLGTLGFYDLIRLFIYVEAGVL